MPCPAKRPALLCRFKLSRPGEPGAVQDMLGIKEEASFVLSAKVRARLSPAVRRVPMLQRCSLQQSSVSCLVSPAQR